MYCVLLCTDKPDSLALRQATRTDHLAFIATLGDRVKLAGFFYDQDKNPKGSMIVLEVTAMDEAEKIATDDPYAKAGLFSDVEIKPWHWTINAPDA